MKIAITGATSFIGKKLVEMASGRAWEVVAVIRRNSDKEDALNRFKNVSIVKLDMQEYEQIGELVGAVDCFVHLAWNGTRSPMRDNCEIQEQNYIYSLAAVKSMIDAGCKRIITIGSQAEYAVSDGIITEETPCRPNTEYGKYKLKFFEDVSKLAVTSGISHKELRIFSLYGPGDFENTLIAQLIRKMKKNEPCELTDCVQIWDYLYLDDAVEAILAVCEKECADGAYNLGSGDVRPLKEYVSQMLALSNSSSPLLYGAVPYHASGMVSICPSVAKLKKEVNWTPRVAFDEGFKRLLEYADDSLPGSV